jgi:hypothetical protein
MIKLKTKTKTIIITIIIEIKKNHKLDLKDKIKNHKNSYKMANETNKESKEKEPN